ncbi:MAG: HD domain-containing phosphohydrolase [Gammaproteobacteria bacterium]|jgi:hypothetical protein|nr:HD domain-containing phosphohydrolase [Gammaproteobacteria bacterium]HJO11858.1 HD domain-containing phosphohydrolase [Gammaproteobacteria bacterium]|tara:strand:- start:1457 stop:2101 length:645 start_codon:yes stop_codon:yes gene_type:complete
MDNRLGLSRDEEKQKDCEADSKLPVEEKLLSNRVDHIVSRTIPNPFGDNPWGFTIDVPKYFYNYGEVYNLCIERGTLTSEERFKINDHVIQTITMLEQLPFPEHLRQVPEIAGGHHETLIGTGYPRRLKKQDMSVKTRIMVIADIFEALTAPDRPYKEGKTLNQALKIMSFMCKDQYIDNELFNLFLNAGIYKTYAKKYLDPAQIDNVDISQFM